ncbi:uncharacterized protein LOC128806827 [Vidua macroura]|uniref:uncharacterized protein LOC128806827 n=1 Tax=Vidua macroura TaxID=187451 RepID=UPI0023A87227|nr:uncharacterized protein LOC128806827 [Vidua macroura]
MSSRQRKRPGGAIDSRPARKRSRLLPSSAGGTSQTEPRDLEESATPAFEPEVIDLTGEDTIDLTGEDVIELRVEDVIDLTGEDAVDLPGEDVIDLTGEEEVIDLTGEDAVDLRGEDVIDLTGEEEVIDLTGEDVIDLTGEEVIDLTGEEEVIDLTGEDVVDLTGEDAVDLRGEDVIDLTGEDVIDLTGEEVIDLTGEEEVIDLTGEEVIDLTGEDVVDLTGEEVIDLTGEDVVDLTDESLEPEVIIISDDESPMDREQSQQQLHLSRASAEPLARDDEEEPRDIDGSALSSDWLLFDFDLPYWSDEDSEDREQNQQHPHVSSASGNSADLLASGDEEEPREVDGVWPAGPASPLAEENEDSEDWEPPHFFRTAENSAELPARDTEEEPRDNQGWPDGVYVALLPVYYYPGWWYLQQQLHFVRAVLAMGNNEEEQRDNDEAQPAGPASPPASEDEVSELLEVHGQERRNVTLNSQEQVAGSGNGAGANDVPVADLAPAEQGAEEEDTESSDAQQGVVIRCPICMEYYAEFVRRGRQLVAALCGHVFCSRCLPIALEASHMCPVCRMDLDPELYHHIYL